MHAQIYERLPPFHTHTHTHTWVQEELYKARLGALKREEDMVRQEAARLDTEKAAYIRWGRGGGWPACRCACVETLLHIRQATHAAIGE